MIEILTGGYRATEQGGLVRATRAELVAEIGRLRATDTVPPQAFEIWRKTVENKAKIVDIANALVVGEKLETWLEEKIRRTRNLGRSNLWIETGELEKMLAQLEYIMGALQEARAEFAARKKESNEAPG